MQAFKVSAMLSLIVTIAGLAEVVLLGNLQSYVQLVLGLLWFVITVFRIKRGKPLKGKVSDYLAGRILLFVLFLFFGVAVVSPIPTGNKFQYPVQMRYLDWFGYENDFFPEKLPDKVEDYEMRFMPSMMQGRGWTKVSFKTDSATIEQYIEELAAKGCKAEPLADYNVFALMGYRLPKKFKENLQACQIYVVGFEDNWGCAYIECVVVNEELGYVMFLEE